MGDGDASAAAALLGLLLVGQAAQLLLLAALLLGPRPPARLLLRALDRRGVDGPSPGRGLRLEVLRASSAACASASAFSRSSWAIRASSSRTRAWRPGPRLPSGAGAETAGPRSLTK